MMRLRRLMVLALIVMAACRGTGARAGCGGKPPPPHVPGLTVMVEPDGVSFTTTDRGRVGEGCQGDAVGAGAVTIPRLKDGGAHEHDLAAVTRCARTLKTTVQRLADSAVSISASPETRYADLLAVLDALRRDEGGELFPQVDFVADPSRLRASTRAQHSVSATGSHSGSPPLPDSRPPPTEPGDGITVLVTQTEIAVDDEKVLQYEATATLRTSGLPAKYKSAGETDLFIASLGKRLVAARQERERQSKGTANAAAIVICDGEVPYSVLSEVLYTMGQSEISTYHLMILQRSK